ncbi:WD40-repeat-containing domain protein [Suillus clintonianus]|uniref:WD40-repeat-containing domain protein n=1 Tax=Suillus clintonianus TaxID=1904413 RepID=UPI001B87E92B|nr:WD40-repeat-containing domain protein [Suillus clintonianus]KAG2110799.1 WD40-repeat-containing domain protein [Suillus clintonianus]
MASTSTKAAATKLILKPKMTLKGHGLEIRSISYFPDGQRIISGSFDKTARQWDLKAGKELEKARGVCENEVSAVAVSRDGRWVVTASGNHHHSELKACEVEMGIVKEFKGHSAMIECIDISADSKLLASGSRDFTARIWNLETGELVAGPFQSVDWVGAVRFPMDSKKLAVNSWVGKCLEVWDIQKQKLDARMGKPGGGRMITAPIFWTNNNKTILAAFNFTDDLDAKTIYEFNALTLETVGTPFEGHTRLVTGLALSSDNTLLASASANNTINLWAFESRQLLASLDVQDLFTLALSPDSRKIAYTTATYDEYKHKICICDIPRDVLAQARTSARKTSNLNDLLNSDAPRRPPTVPRRPPIPVIPMVQRPPPIINPQQPILLRLRKLLPFSSHTAAIPPVRNHIEPRGPLDLSATLPLPHSLSGPTATQGRSDINSSENPRPLSTIRSSAATPTTFSTRLHNISTWWPVRAGHALPPIVDVPLAPGQLRNAAAGAPGPDNEYIREEDYVPPELNTGTHGSDRYCFCC